MSFLSARDFTLVMLAIVFFAAAGSIALLTPLPSVLNAWAAAGLSATALVMLFLALLPNCFRRHRAHEPLPKHASPRIGRSAP